MIERDLDRLKSSAVPPARADAKRAAIDAAVAAFDEAFIGSSDTPRNAAVESAVADSDFDSQGNVTPLRQTETSTRKRSFRMYLSSRSTQAMAASVAALVIAAPFAFQHLSTLRKAPTISRVQSETNASSQKEVVVAVAPPAAKDARIADALPATPAAEEKQKSDTPSNAATLPAPEPAQVELDVRPGSSGRITAPLTVDRKDLALKGADISGKKVELAIPHDGLGAVAQSGSTMHLSLGGGTREAEHAALNAPPAPPPAPSFAARSLLGMADKAAGSSAYQSERRMRGDIADAEKARPQAQIGGIDTFPVVTSDEGRDRFDAREINPVKQVATEPVSTFSIDVDTASYAFVRRALNSGRLPPKDAVRVEEMINYFPYAYPSPETVDVPFKPTVTVLPSPWNANNKLVHVAIKGYDIKGAERPRANLVFLIDVSGSMGPADRLPLLKNAFRMLVEQLKANDTVAIVTYASGSGVALEPTKVSEKGKILAAIDRLDAGGSTAGAAGISDAYRLAEAGFDKSAVNRVVLATDGDFNVGITDQSELKSFIERKRQSGIFLSILGVGQGNHNDALMQTLAQNGNGTAAYVDTLNEARKVLVEESSSTLFTIAKDVKAQIEWNPERVAEYRLVGYETRALRREDFNNDAVDAGDIGSGHTVTAIYEVTPVGAPVMADGLRYGKVQASDAAPREVVKPSAAANELGFLKLRYKRPNDMASQLISLPVTDELAKPRVTDGPGEQRFSIAVAAFAQLLKGESYMQGYTFDDVIALAQPVRGDDPFGYRAEFLNLVRLAKSAQP